MPSVVSTCKVLANPISPSAPSNNPILPNISIENLPLDDLFKLLAQHRQHLDFLKQYDMCDVEKTKSIVAKCELVFNIIHSRTASTSDNGVSLN